jgi:hypothetical protein
VVQRAAALLLMLCLASPAARPQGPVADPEAVARQLVAEALGVPATSTHVVSSEPREFADASLDCPAPGMAYAQVLTPGWVVIVEAEGRRFDVRVAGHAGRICHRRQGGRASTVLSRPEPAALAEAARQDLAGRLALDAAGISVLNIRRLSAGEVVPGCGLVCTGDDARCGYGIRLLADERTFDYVSQGEAVRPCPEIASR